MRIALAAAALMLPAQAQALSCMWGPVASLPSQDAVDVPTNAVLRVLIEGDEAIDPVLLDARGDGVAVHVDVHHQGSQRLITLQPDRSLHPSSDYTLDLGLEEGWEWELAFRTGAAPDVVAPGRPDIMATRRDRGRTVWGPTNQVEVELAAFDEPVMLRMDLVDSSSGQDLGTVFSLPHHGEGSAHAWAGQGLCSNTAILRGGVNLDLTAIDQAGNRSPTPPRAKVGGCTSLGAPASGLGLVLALAGVGTRRRRRRARTSG